MLMHRKVDLLDVENFDGDSVVFYGTTTESNRLSVSRKIINRELIEKESKRILDVMCVVAELIRILKSPTESELISLPRRTHSTLWEKIKNVFRPT